MCVSSQDFAPRESLYCREQVGESGDAPDKFSGEVCAMRTILWGKFRALAVSSSQILPAACRSFLHR